MGFQLLNRVRARGHGLYSSCRRLRGTGIVLVAGIARKLAPSKGTGEHELGSLSQFLVVDIV